MRRTVTSKENSDDIVRVSLCTFLGAGKNAARALNEMAGDYLKIRNIFL